MKESFLAVKLPYTTVFLCPPPLIVVSVEYIEGFTFGTTIVDMY